MYTFLEVVLEVIVGVVVMVVLLVLVAVLVKVGLVCGGSVNGSGEGNGSVTSGNISRTFVINLPEKKFERIFRRKFRPAWKIVNCCFARNRTMNYFR